VKSNSLSPRLKAISLRKTFGSTVALDEVSLEVHPGEVVALVGENGAGKSTLLKILSGAHQADSGALEMNGQPYLPRSPHQARKHGVAMIYQELSLAPHLTVLENILLGIDITRWGILKSHQERAVATRALERIGHLGMDLHTRVDHLSPAARQVVEIARALAGDAQLLIMDEPTSSLTTVDTHNLFKVIRELKPQGVSILYVSHFLEEVVEVADRVVVLRDGRSVGEGSLDQMSIPQIIRLMVGREIQELFPTVAHHPGEVLFQVTDLAGLKLPRGVSFEVHRGEVLGIGGLVGSGRTELLRALFGLDPIRSGQIRLATLPSNEGEEGRIPLRPLSLFQPKPPASWQAGIGMVSEDRKEEGLATQLSIAENLCITQLSPYTWYGIFLPWKRRENCTEWIHKLGVVCKSSDQPLSSLSGGNQQKIAFGRLLHHDADLLLLDEPTRGIDVGSKAHLYRLIGEVAAQGKAVIMISSYLPELFGVCDRLAVMRRGTLSEIRPVTAWTEEELMSFAVAEGHQ
jgi:ribose transport system ATP-binding protein